MTLPPEREAAIKARLDSLVEASQAARDAPDPDTARRLLNAVWHAVHVAQETIRDAETATRREALANVEGTAA